MGKFALETGTRKIALWKIDSQKIASTLILIQSLTLNQGEICLGAIFRGKFSGCVETKHTYDYFKVTVK